MNLDFENFKKATDIVEVIMSDKAIDIRHEVLTNLDAAPEKMKLSFLRHASTLFMNVHLNRLAEFEEFGYNAKLRAENAMDVISEIIREKRASSS